MPVLAAVLAAALAAAPLAPSLPYFSDVTEEAGIRPLKFGEGVNAVDFDADGLVDLFLPCVRGKPRLLRNSGTGKFLDVSEASGFKETGGIGATAGDLTGDGRPDLYLVRGADPFVAGNLVYTQNADWTFLNVSEAAGVSAKLNGIAATLLDADGDRVLDVFVAGWGRNSLYLNHSTEGVPVLAEATDQAGLGEPGRCWIAVASDVNGDGRTDLLVTRGSFDKPEGSRLYLARGDGTFEDATEQAGLSAAPFSMGAASADFDGDGDFDLYVAGYGGPGRLYLNDGKARFTDITRDSGIRAEKVVGVAAGPIFGGFLPDLVVGGFAGPARVYKNLGGGKFADVTAEAGLKSFIKNEGVALADLDGDGDLDLYVTNYDGNNRLYRNNLSGGRYVKIRFAPGPVSPVGAVARLYRAGTVGHPEGLLASQELQSANGLGQGPEEFLFRLPDDGAYDLKIVLPGGAVVERPDVQPGTLILP